ncbi:hypothetical protein BDY17DRAFT_1334 [Neohortaea acidophila]|uniref:Uncharacterized protein n=1 Tax=Neohortaea acidophila TaxID=245834 RepID=A0A6A6Q5W0_9PEZI|nr:uncharacterized protein BDY17DRAFT_1334 [Neohortaea acidophila]KAF2487023.1 hypothetical protein BDY17DRAFT_1334 [Neohortaea acidophila]
MAHHASSQAHGEEQDDILQGLMAMNSRERVEAFRSHFIQTVVPLHLLKQPPLCEDYPPDFSDDIVASYLRFTTFTVTVRVNYDAACKQFYTDRRVQNCGKLVFPPKAERKLMRIPGIEEIPFRRVRFEIGTPFQELAAVLFTMVNTKDGGRETRARWKMVTNEEHLHLTNFIDDTCAYIENNCSPSDDYDGFQLNDIRLLAGRFSRHQTERELAMKHRQFIRREGVWMDLEEDYENEGWTDFDALGKTCSMSCEGCTSGYISGIRRLRARRIA